MSQNEELEILEFELAEVKQEAPKHYKETNFISLLEKEGIGRPSTYALFLPTLLKRNFVELRKKGKTNEIYATSKGIDFIAKLKENEDEWITKSEYTRQMENILDEISKGNLDYKDFIRPLHEKMNFVKLTSNESKPPSEKQLEFAKNLAKNNNTELPKDIEKDYKICNAFIEKMKKQIPPSEKQIQFAKKLANENKVDLPQNYDKSVEICSKFIDKYIKKAKK